VALGREQFVLGCLGVIVRDGLGTGRLAGIACCRRPAQDAAAFPAGRDSQPAGQRGRDGDGFQLVDKCEPDVLTDVLGVGVAQPVPAADRPDQRGVPFHQRVPRLVVTVPGAGHQIGDRSATAALVCATSEVRVRGHGFLPVVIRR
jgi:hypothetical protein